MSGFFSFYNGGYLSGENLGFWLFNVKINCEYNFYWVFGTSGGFTFGVCNSGYCYICCCFMGLLKLVCIYCERNS